MDTLLEEVLAQVLGSGPLALLLYYMLRKCDNERVKALDGRIKDLQDEIGGLRTEASNWDKLG